MGVSKVTPGIQGAVVCMSMSMRYLLMFSILIWGTAGQRRPGTCPEGGLPRCADGSRPRPQLRKPPACKDGASPVCRNGSPPPRPGICGGGRQPMCGTKTPVCPDGSALSAFGRPCDSGAPICEDSSQRPRCEESSRPVNGDPSVGFPLANRPLGGPNEGRPLGGPQGGRPLGGPPGGRPLGGPQGGRPFGGFQGQPSTNGGPPQSTGPIQQGTSETGYETTVKVRQTWEEQPAGYDSEALVKVPPSSPGQRWPVVLDLHGAGGAANLRRLSDISDSFVIVAASGYNRFWNVYSEKTKADDVDFLLKLIKKIGEDIPEADTEDVTIVGTSNGAGMIYRLLIETRSPRPFKRVFPLASSLINIQYHDDSFWLEDKVTKLWNIPTVPEKPGPTIIHFHGTDDGTVPYNGGGGNFLGVEVDFLDAQTSDYIWAKTYGYTGPQLGDGEGTVVKDGVVKYSYLGGKVVHCKLEGLGHGVLGSPQYKNFIMETIKTSAYQ